MDTIYKLTDQNMRTYNGQMGSDLDYFNKKETAQRIAEYNGEKFIVEYDYYPGRGGSVPMTNPPGKMHYSAVVRVYRIVGKDRTKIGKDINGIYVDGGCFEDKPEIFIKEALEAVR